MFKIETEEIESQFLRCEKLFIFVFTLFVVLSIKACIAVEVSVAVGHIL